MISYGICLLLGLISAVVLTILLYVMVLPESKANTVTGFLKFVRDFFLFKKLYIEAVLRFLYTFSTLFSICFGVFLLVGKKQSFSLFSTSESSTFGLGLFFIVVCPILLRISYELLMLMVILVTNVIAINGKLNGKSGKEVQFADENSLTEKFSSVATDAAKNVMNEVQNMGIDNDKKDENK
ncbi:MAG: hypothetical protein E7254_09310 [Lachnospiraceae bacterium]|nr:hypothetical protein [Lachnospiraceae bacterium]